MSAMMSLRTFSGEPKRYDNLAAIKGPRGKGPVGGGADFSTSGYDRSPAPACLPIIELRIKRDSVSLPNRVATLLPESTGK